MALTDDQRSLLQLLLEGGQDYADIASLLGVDEAAVRSRARAALREIGGADPDAEVGLTDYLLGQADPIGRADAARQLQRDPGANQLASRLIAQLRLLAPRAQLPEVPAPRGGSRPSGQAMDPAAAAGAEQTQGPRRSLGSFSSSQSRVLAALAAGAVLVVAVVLVVVGLGDDDGDGSTGGSDGTAAAANPNLTVVPLGSVEEGSDAGGQATFGQSGNQALVQLNLSGLDPSQGSQAYVVWLYTNDRISYPLGFFRADQQGNFTGPAPVPPQALELLGQFGCMDVSRVPSEQDVRRLRRATRRQSLPGYEGESVLRGEISLGSGEPATGADADCARPQPQD